jgi:1,4-dihydroxy-2-naphthoyl-CoA synthase
MRFLREVGPLTTRKLFLTARHFEAREGLAAFAEKRKPIFKGK